MTFLVQIPRPVCCKCDDEATFELIDNKNAKRGRYCEKHGQPALKALAETEGATR